MTLTFAQIMASAAREGTFALRISPEHVDEVPAT